MAPSRWPAVRGGAQAIGGGARGANAGRAAEEGAAEAGGKPRVGEEVWLVQGYRLDGGQT